MDRKSKIFFIVLGLLIAVSVGVTYWRIMVKKDYIVEGQADCDPTVDKCFVWKCDPKSDVEGEKCTGDPESDIWYFQVARRNAAKIPLCDPDKDENCAPWTCGENEKDCSVAFCTEDQLEAQYAAECSDPVQYNIDNPPEAETACEEGDEACASAEGSAEEAEPAEDSPAQLPVEKKQ